MTSVGAVALGRTASLVVAVVLLFCGELRFTANAFQTTNRFGKPLSLSKPVGRATLQPLQQRPVGRKGRGDEGRFFVTLEATPANATSANGLDDESAPEESVEISDAVEASSSTTAVASETDIPSEAFFPPPKAGDSSEEKTDSTTTKGRKRRAIQRMRQQYFSRPIESRLGRTLVFPVRTLIWKPLWMVFDFFLDRLEDDSTAVLDSGESSTDSLDDELIVAVSTAVLDDIEQSFEEEEDQTTATTLEASDETPLEEVTPVVEIESPKEDVVTEPVVAVTETPKETPKEEPKFPRDTPEGDRWAVAAPGVDLSGIWELIVTDDFKVEYDKYLERLGQPKIVRSVALSGPVISQTMEELIQIDQGRSLLIKGKNIRGTWDRTLVASGTTKFSDEYEPLVATIPTVDQELVKAEAWWEDEGTSHISWMRGVTMYGGGSFYSKRYMEEKAHPNDEDVYACYSFFEFNDPKKENNVLTWRFRRRKTKKR